MALRGYLSAEIGDEVREGEKRGKTESEQLFTRAGQRADRIAIDSRLIVAVTCLASRL